MASQLNPSAYEGLLPASVPPPPNVTVLRERPWRARVDWAEVGAAHDGTDLPAPFRDGACRRGPQAPAQSALTSVRLLGYGRARVISHACTARYPALSPPPLHPLTYVYPWMAAHDSGGRCEVVPRARPRHGCPHWAIGAGHRAARDWQPPRLRRLAGTAATPVEVRAGESTLGLRVIARSTMWFSHAPCAHSAAGHRPPRGAAAYLSASSWTLPARPTASQRWAMCPMR